MSNSGEIPLLQYYGRVLEVEIFDTLDIGLEQACININDNWEHVSVSSTRILGNLCTKLLRGDTNYNILLESLLEKVIRVLDADIGSIATRNGIFDDEISEDPHMICVASGEKIPGILISNEDVHVKKVKKIDGIFGHVITTNKAVISNNLADDPRTKKSLPANHPKISNFIGIPLKYQDVNLGILTIANCEKRSKPFDLDSILTIFPLLDICTRLLMKSLDTKESLSSKIKQASEADEAKDRFLATMSHELRTPLNGILGMVTLLPDAGPLNEKQTEYIKNLTECAVELTSLLNNILDFSKMAANRLTLRKQPIFIQSIVKDVIKMVEGNLLAKGLELQLHTPKELPTMMGDAQRLAQVLTNLLGNAVKFTEMGSIDVTITAKALSSKDLGEATVRKWKILFVIKDTGIGIPYDEQEKIFEVFHQASSLSTYLSKSGTGLGLSIVRELVRLMGGKISVQSEGIHGKGSTFTFYIILDEEIDITGLSEAYVASLEGARILVVDDRPDMRIQISDILFKWKCIPQAVSSAEEALQYLQYGMEFKLALVDICMPNMSGVELAQELRLKYPELPLIGISSIELSSGEEYFDYYMYKPVDQNTLFPAVLNCLNHPKGCSPVAKKRTLKSRSRLKILVAEDNSRNAYTIREMLLNLGYSEKNISIVEDGEACVAAVTKSGDSLPDVVLMDIIMPKMDGLQASRLIKRLPHPPMIIAVSAAVQPSDKAKCQNAGIDGYLAKPLMKEKLDAALSPLIRHSHAKKPSVSRKKKAKESKSSK